MAKSKTVLLADMVSKHYGNQPVLSDISLELRAGEWLAILGESGSGKSTLLRIFGRFLDSDQGKVFFNGEELKSVSRELIPGHESIRLIHQEFELFPNQTVEENIAYSLRFYDSEYRGKRVEELLETAGLGYVRKQKAKLLSGGEKQRTAIAKALAEQPQVLLLDEPFAHLDNQNRRVLGNAIEKMRSEQKTSCIFVTHESSDALAWSDRIAVLRNGKIIQVGTPAEVYNRPIDSYVAELTGGINWLGSAEKRFFIRPEKIKPTRYPEKSKWKGKVEAIRFHGNYWEIRCTNGQEQLSFYRNKLTVEIGQEVFLTYAAKDLGSI
jgi:iron(III) transport system ATP-binding protein